VIVLIQGLEVREALHEALRPDAVEAAVEIEPRCDRIDLDLLVSQVTTTTYVARLGQAFLPSSVSASLHKNTRACCETNY
jgi:hypothetical protein